MGRIKFLREKNIRSQTRLVKLQTAIKNQNTKSNYNATCVQQQKHTPKTKPTKPKQTNHKPIFEREHLLFKKRGTAKFKPATFAVPIVLVASSHKNFFNELNLNLRFLILTILRTKLFTGKKSSTRLQYPCFG